jgi:hypothetical protein
MFYFTICSLFVKEKRLRLEALGSTQSERSEQKERRSNRRTPGAVAGPAPCCMQCRRPAACNARMQCCQASMYQ